MQDTMSNEEIGEAVDRIWLDPSKHKKTKCPAFAIYKDVDALIGREGGTVTRFCKMMWELAPPHVDRCLLYEDEDTGTFLCIYFGSTQREIESELKKREAKTPSVEDFIGRGEYIDYSIYAKLRRKIER